MGPNMRTLNTPGDGMEAQGVDTTDALYLFTLPWYTALKLNH